MIQLTGVRDGEWLKVEVDNFFDGVEYEPHVFRIKVVDIKRGRCTVLIDDDKGATMRGRKSL